MVVASYDRTFEYRKLQIAFDALWFHKRARLITSNPDRYCPMPGGRGEPDAAAVVAAIEACTGVTCEANLGKPGAEMLETVLGMLGLSADRCVVVGDRLSTDIAMAATAGHGLGAGADRETTRRCARLPQGGHPPGSSTGSILLPASEETSMVVEANWSPRPVAAHDHGIAALPRARHPPATSPPASGSASRGSRDSAQAESRAHRTAPRPGRQLPRAQEIRSASDCGSATSSRCGGDDAIPASSAARRRATYEATL